ncbi:MiaB/RimO family radical SAM methylthiotransferase [Patescibacteria group bacterium]|nr:MiaB/RimO family radical SAM methylthiotransferase [Patescibacteria group bacterium]
MKKYFIKTFGCLANESDSERIASFFEKRGFKPSTFEDANVIVINTCSVRESAENRVFGFVNNLVKKGFDEKKKKIIITGCMVGSAKGERRRFSLKQLKKKFPDVCEFKTIDELVFSDSLPLRKRQAFALIPIMEGCNNFCSYCVVPFARGEEASRDFDEIACEVETLSKKGYEEIMLLGQNVNSYGKDLRSKKVSFANLLTRLNKIKGIKKISFMTSNPWDLTDDIIETFSLSKIDKYLHLPVQSGSDEILKKMNRKYTSKDYLKLVSKIRKRIPEIKIGTDIIVGFPGETEKQFEETLSLVKKINFVKAYISRYSPRPGTTASFLKDDVSPSEKRRRWKLLDELINKN